MKQIVILFIFSLFIQSGSAQSIKRIKATELESVIASARHPLILNFWATWCAPCLEEIPWFQEIVAAHKADSIQLILVSLDVRKEYPDGVKKIAKKRDFRAPILWLDETNADYFCPKVDSTWSGAIPATLLINNQTGYRKFHEAQLSRDELTREIKALLNRF
jgi:thiol-disulfide isomerase/thioredoxin